MFEVLDRKLTNEHMLRPKALGPYGKVHLNSGHADMTEHGYGNKHACLQRTGIYQSS
jgi:hypothetical protein